MSRRSTSSKKRKKKKGCLGPFLFLLVLAVVIIAGIMIFRTYHNRKSAETEAIDETSETMTGQGAEDGDSPDEPQSDLPDTETPDATEEEMYAYYALLNDDQKTVYRQLVDAVEQGITTITPEAGVTQEEFAQVTSAVYLDQPRLFWLVNSWSCTFYSADGDIITGTVAFNELADDLDANRAAFQSASEEILNELEGLSTTEKEKAIHDWLVSNVDYVAGSLDQTAYSAIVGHATVCTGYTRAFQYLMQAEGIPTYVVEGDSVNTASGEWEAHAWNIVKLKEGYYNVDVTWDDPTGSDGSIYYTYYNCTDADLASNHARNEASSALPGCDATECSFENLYGMAPGLYLATQMGLTHSEAITSLDDFYEILADDIVEAGTGTNTYSYALTEDVMDGVNQDMAEDRFFDQGIQPAISRLKMNGYSYSCNNVYVNTGDGYYHVSFEITLN